MSHLYKQRYQFHFFHFIALHALGTGIIPPDPKVLLVISFANVIDGFNTGFAIVPLCELVPGGYLGFIVDAGFVVSKVGFAWSKIYVESFSTTAFWMMIEIEKVGFFGIEKAGFVGVWAEKVHVFIWSHLIDWTLFSTLLQLRNNTKINPMKK